MLEPIVTNILLVEDDKVDVMNVRRSFKKANITNPLYVASNGLEGLAILRGEFGEVSMPLARRLVLLDLNMPKMGGIEFLKALRQDPALRSTPVIVLTTSDQEKDRIEAYNLNVAGYLLKPVTFVRFAEAMSALNRYWTLCEIP
ncbi:MAG: response regulator [Phormidesmis sp.]